MNIEKRETVYTPRSHDEKMIAQLLSNNIIDKPGSWESGFGREDKDLSCAEKLVLGVATNNQYYLGPYRFFNSEDRLSRNEEIKNFIVVNRLSDKPSFNLSLLKAALVAECVPENILTNEIQTWLVSLRGERRVLTEKQREAMSMAFGLIQNPDTLNQIGRSVGISRSGVRSRIDRGLRLLRIRYWKLIGQTFTKPNV